MTSVRRRRWPLVLGTCAGVAVILAGGMLWVRTSSLVAIRHVRITGVSGPDAARIRSVLRVAATGMTTLDLDVAELRTVVAPYPQVKSISAAAQFPHGLTIRVREQIPVAEVLIGGSSIVVASDGTLLRGVTNGAGSLPVIPLAVPPGGANLTEPGALAALKVLTAAPYRLLPHIQQATNSAAHGVIVNLRNGPDVYFGDPSELSAKWAAVLAVLSNPSSAGASYLDVTDPRRPAAGVPLQPGSAAAAGLEGSAGTATGPAAGTTAATIAGTSSDG